MRATLWSSFAKAEILARLQDLPDVSVDVVADKAAFLVQASRADAVILSGHVYDAEVAAALRQAPGLRWIQLYTAGYETLQTLGVPPGVVVTNAGAAWAPGVAEHALAVMLALTRHLPDAFAEQQKARWDRGFSARNGTLQDRTLAIVGFGNIGREVARRARGFGMRIIGVARSAREEELADEVLPTSHLHAVLGRADVVVLALPWSPDTNRVMNAKALAAMRPGALLINVSRGNLVDHAALRAALESGQLGGAALDVTDPEPLPDGDKLWSCPNLVITPHTSGSCGVSGRLRVAAVVAENTARFLAGETLTNVVMVEG
jgi:phosphoglycerate dehydrogenase-like enzyme